MIRVPTLLQQSSLFECLSIDGLTFVAYRQRQQVLPGPVFFEQHSIIFVRAGEKRVMSGVQSFRVQPGEALFVQRGCYYLAEMLPATDDYQSLLFFFDEQLLAGFLARNPDLLLPTTNDCSVAPVFPLTMTPALRQFLISMEAASPYQTPYRNRLLHLRFDELLLHLLNSPEASFLQTLLRAVANQHKPDLALTVQTYLLQPLTIRELASLTNRSLSAFKREFSQQIGLSPAAYIRNQRLEYARMLLQTGSGNVSEVCMAVGYESVSHFIKNFRKRYGFTPNGYLKTKNAIC